MNRSFVKRLVFGLVFVSIIFLTGYGEENADAVSDITTQELALGKKHLPETRTATQLAEGVSYTEISRGYVSDEAHYTVEAGFFNTRDEAKNLAGDLKEHGYQAKVEKLKHQNRKYTDVDDKVIGYIVQIGTFAQEQKAEEPAAQAVGDGYEDTNVTYSEFDGTAATTGPWRLNVIEINPEQFQGEMTNVLAHDEIQARETVSSMAGRSEAIAGINGGYFVVGAKDGIPGDPAGIFMTDGQLVSEAIGERTSLLLANNEIDLAEVSTELRVETEDGTSALIDGINREAGKIRSCGGVGDTPANQPMHDVTCTDSSEIIQYDTHFGEKTPAGEGFEVVVEESGKVTATHEQRGHSIPEKSTILAATGKQASWLRDAVSREDELILTEEVIKDGRPLEKLSGLDIIGGGPQLLSSGSIEIQAKEEGFRWSKDFYYSFAESRHPRSLVGIKENGNILLVTADGRSPEESIGLSFYESAQVLQSLGAVEGMNLDGGGSTSMTVGEEIVNQPSDPAGERPVSDGIFLLK